MVYEHLPRQIKHHHVLDPSKTNDYSPLVSTDKRLVLIRRCLPVTILSTCKLVYVEAANIVRNTIKDFILSSSPRIIFNTQSRLDFPFQEMVDYCTEKCDLDGKNKLICKSHVQSFWDLTRDRLSRADVEKTLKKFIAQSNRQLVYHAASKPEEKFPIRYLMLDEPESPGYHQTLAAFDLCPMFFRPPYEDHCLVPVAECAGVLPSSACTARFPSVWREEWSE
jgi:hypothetical protein